MATVHDTKWRMVAVFRGSDAYPKERFVWHQAGLLGGGGSSYIDTVVFRDRDANSGWTSAADGTLEERVYYCQNWRADVSVVMSSSGLVKEWVKYSAYGVPFRVDPADYDGDGFVGGGDYDTFVADWELSEPRADVDFDDFVTGGDFDLYVTNFENAHNGGAGILTAFSNRIGYAGYQHALELSGAKWHVRHRVFDSEVGRWGRRDPLGYVDGMNMYSYVYSSPLWGQDPFGREGGSQCHGSCDNSGGSSGSHGGSLGHQATPPFPPVTPPGAPLERTPEECCKIAEERGYHRNPRTGGLSQGKTICCDGVKVSCAFLSDDAQCKGKPRGPAQEGCKAGADMVRNCIRRHEDTHHTDVMECPSPPDVSVPDWLPGIDQPGEECKAYQAEAACYQQMRQSCKQRFLDPLKDKINSRKDIEEANAKYNACIAAIEVERAKSARQEGFECSRKRKPK